MSKPPSHFDGKPIGTPMDAKSPFHAGVTMGPDQVERMEQLRRLRNRAWKAAAKAERAAHRAAYTPESREEYKRRRNRADRMTRALRNGTPIPNVANYYGVTPDDVLAEVKWLSTHRNRHRSRNRKPDSKRYPLLPERALKSSQSVDAVDPHVANSGKPSTRDVKSSSLLPETPTPTPEQERNER